MEIKQKGKKGGVSVFSPETIGAMTGAAIGGLTGLVLGSKKAREKLAKATEKALHGPEETPIEKK